MGFLVYANHIKTQRYPLSWKDAAIWNFCPKQRETYLSKQCFFRLRRLSSEYFDIAKAFNVAHLKILL